MDIIVNGTPQPIITPVIPNNSDSATNNSGAMIINSASPSQTPALTAVVSSTSSAANNIKQAVTQLNDHVQTLQRSLEFSSDQGLMVVKVVDTNTNKLIMQIPSQAALDMAQALNMESNNSFNIFSSKA